MDLNTVTEMLAPAAIAEVPAWRNGDAWLGGGTWLFSEPQPAVRRLIDVTTLGWEPIVADETGLTVAATCTIARLAAFATASDWPAAPLMLQCCRSLLGSFKVWNMATVGGNLCMALPAGPMISLMASLGAEAVIWPQGDEAAARRVPVAAFVQGVRRTALAPSDLLRAVTIPAAALRARTAFRRISLNPIGRSGALVIGVHNADGFALTITAATPRPVRLVFPALPDEAALLDAIERAIPLGGWYDDVHGLPEWRRAVTRRFAAEIRRELVLAA